MTGEEKTQKREEFMEWTTFIEDRVDAWSASSAIEWSGSLDYSPESLTIVEKYMLANFNADSLKDPLNKIAIDALVSYYGETLRRNIPKSTWYIELDDESSVDFNTPAIKAPIGPLLGLYFLLKRLISKNKGTFLFDLYQKMLARNK